MIDGKEYFVTVTGENGCSLSSSVVFNIDQDVDKESQNNDVQISPNPSSGIFNVKVLTKELEDFELTVFNLAGQELKSISMLINQNEIQLDLSELANGVYILVFELGTEIIHHKVIIAR